MSGVVESRGSEVVEWAQPLNVQKGAVKSNFKGVKKNRQLICGDDVIRLIIG